MLVTIASSLIRLLQNVSWSFGVNPFVNMQYALRASSLKKWSTLWLFSVAAILMRAREAQIIPYWSNPEGSISLSPPSVSRYSFLYTSFISSSHSLSKLSDETFGFVVTKNLHSIDSRILSFAIFFRQLRNWLQELLKFFKDFHLKTQLEALLAPSLLKEDLTFFFQSCNYALSEKIRYASICGSVEGGFEWSLHIRQ